MRKIAFIMAGVILWSLAFFSTLGLAQQPTFKRSFTTMTEVGGLFGRVAVGNDTQQRITNKLNFTAQTFNGIQLTPKLAFGGTIGIDWYTAALLLPIAAGIRYDFIQVPQKNIQVFTSADVGYGFAWLHKGSTGYKTKGGLMLSPGIGLRLGRPNNSCFILSMSYKRQEADVQKPIGGNDIHREEHRVYNRIAFRIGISF